MVLKDADPGVFRNGFQFVFNAGPGWFVQTGQIFECSPRELDGQRQSFDLREVIHFASASLRIRIGENFIDVIGIQ